MGISNVACQLITKDFFLHYIVTMRVGVFTTM